MTGLVSTLLVDGTDLRGMAGVRVIRDMNLRAPGTRRGQDDVIPGRTGQVAAAGLPLDAYPFTVTIHVSGDTEGQQLDRLFTVAAALSGVNGDGLVTLTRKLVNPANDGYDEYTAAGRFNSGLALALFNPFVGETDLEFVNLDGRWKRSSDGVWVLP